MANAIGQKDGQANGDPYAKAYPSQNVQFDHQIDVNQYGNAGQPRHQRHLKGQLNARGGLARDDIQHEYQRNATENKKQHIYLSSTGQIFLEFGQNLREDQTPDGWKEKMIS